MPVAKISLDAIPPERTVASGQYGEIYKNLYALDDGKWLSIAITHTAETRLREIANVRRACQRFFAQKEVAAKYGMVTQVEPKDEFNSVMYVKKVSKEMK